MGAATKGAVWLRVHKKELLASIISAINESESDVTTIVFHGDVSEVEDDGLMTNADVTGAMIMTHDGVDIHFNGDGKRTFNN